LFSGRATVSAGDGITDGTLAIGGAFGSAEVRRFVNGSRATILYPATRAQDGRTLPLDSAGKLTPHQWDTLLNSWKERCSLLLATLDPEMIRDDQGVIQAAIIRSADPLVGTSVLLPAFLQRFRAIFGPEILVAIPSENTVYVFPKLANRLPEFRERIVDDFLLSPRPVTTEFFELSRKGIRAAGDLRTQE
jgi:hypothetical protein